VSLVYIYNNYGPFSEGSVENGFYCKQISQQLQLSSINSSVSTPKQCLSVQLSYSSFTVAHVMIQDGTAQVYAFQRDCLSVAHFRTTA
jgi:hypothetical protein